MTATQPMTNVITQVIRDICESEPFDPYHKDAICISSSYLREVLERHLSPDDEGYELTECTEEGYGLLLSLEKGNDRPTEETMTLEQLRDELRVAAGCNANPEASDWYESMASAIESHIAAQAVVQKKAFAFDACLSAGRITQDLYDESMGLAETVLSAIPGFTLDTAIAKTGGEG